MTPERLRACLETIRWRPETLAEAVDVPTSVVASWLTGREAVPKPIAAWIEALCFVHEAAEDTKPPTTGAGFGSSAQLEHIPVYAYNLLRSLGRGPVRLERLFGSDDEGAVFFLVSRGLAERFGEELLITDIGRAIGEVAE